MAAANYYLCDVCGGKAFYDDAVQWEYFNGEIEVLCERCKETHEIVIRPKEITPELVERPKDDDS